MESLSTFYSSLRVIYCVHSNNTSLKYLLETDIPMNANHITLLLTGYVLLYSSEVTKWGLLQTRIVVSGAFMNCVFIPTAVHAIHFFNKYQVLALTANSCFVPLMFTMLPPCITYLIQRFDWRDANLLIGAVCIQVKTCVMCIIHDDSRPANYIVY